MPPAFLRRFKARHHHASGAAPASDNATAEPSTALAPAACPDGAATVVAVAAPQAAPHGHRPPKGGLELELDQLADGRTVAVVHEEPLRPTPPPLIDTPLFPEHLRQRSLLQGQQRPQSAAPTVGEATGLGSAPVPASSLTPEALRLQAIASAAAAAARAEEQRRKVVGGGAAAAGGGPRLPPRPDPLSTRRPTASLRMRRRADAAAAAASSPSSSSSAAYRPRHVKTNYVCTTPDGWRLHLVRTQRLPDHPTAHTARHGPLRPGATQSARAALAAASAATLGGLRPPPPPRRNHPVILVPGLGSSGAYCFDLSPGVSLPDFLADRGWDVWTVELRGNGASDKPRLGLGMPGGAGGGGGARSRWWTVDTHVERDLPALIRFVLRACGANGGGGAGGGGAVAGGEASGNANATTVTPGPSPPKRAHVLGHSMGGMALCGLMARADHAAARVRSVASVGSGLFLEDSDWRHLAPMLPVSHLMPWTVPSGALLRAYGRVMFTPAGASALDALYFVSSNVDHDLARAMMRRNWSDLSVGVVRQVASAFGARGLLTADGKAAYADPATLGKVAAPALFICGDEDRMCPATGAKRTADMWGAALVAQHYEQQKGRRSSGGGGGEQARAQRLEPAASGEEAAPCPYGARFVLCGPGSRVPVTATAAAARPASAPARSSGGGGGGAPQQPQQPQQAPPPAPRNQQHGLEVAATAARQHHNQPPRFQDHYGHFDILMGLRVETEVFPAIAQFFEDHDAPEMPALMLDTPPPSPRL